MWWRHSAGLVKRCARKALRCESGTVATMSAGVLSMLGTCGIVAVDLGMVYLEKAKMRAPPILRRLAVADLDQARRIAETVLADNGIAEFTSLNVITGRYSPDAAIAPNLPLRGRRCPRNAVRVELGRDAPVFFGKPLVDGGSDRRRRRGHGDGPCRVLRRLAAAFARGRHREHLARRHARNDRQPQPRGLPGARACGAGPLPDLRRIGDDGRDRRRHLRRHPER